MKRVLSLAKIGRGHVSPNPLVGAVIVKNGSIAGEGYHRQFGGEHAEIAALKAAGSSAKDAVLYCNLEPCSHWGKTPPCTDAIIKAGVRNVIIGMKDPNPLVTGSGIHKLRNNGIKVKTGVLENECKTLNAFYSKYITSKLPFVTVKMAQTLDGKIAKMANTRTQLTAEKAQRFVHSLRAEYDAVLIGKKTAIIDNPLLTPRLVSGRVPARIILDTHLKCKPSLKIFSTAELGSIYIATGSQDAERKEYFRKKGIGIIQIKTDKTGFLHLPGFLTELGNRQITSLLVEGGVEVFTSFLRERLIDRIILLIAPYIFGEGVNVVDIFSTNGSIVKLKDITRKQLGQDYMVTGTPDYI